MDEVRIYNRVLTDLEVRGLKNSPKGMGTTTIDGDSITTGYNNTIISSINNLEIFKGGDLTLNKFISWTKEINNAKDN